MYRQREVAAMLMAAGSSARMGFDKLFHKIDGVEVFRLALGQLDGHPYIDRLVIVTSAASFEKMRRALGEDPPKKPWALVRGGASRAASVKMGLAACAGASLIAIHDGARPFVSPALISRTIEAAAEVGAAAPALPLKDTVKRVEEGMVADTVPRHSLRAVQTPQVFDGAAFPKAFDAIDPAGYEGITDDCLVMEKAGRPVRLVVGEEANRKITIPEDLKTVEQKTNVLPRIGQGYDVHRLVEGRRLVLGGVDVPFEKGLLGHSDADVLLHAVADALLGAAALGDIGAHFPDSDPAYKDADSLALLKKTAALVRAAGFAVGNLDATLICQRPKLLGYIPQMRENIAGATGAPVGAVSVKATTEEGLGFTGAGEGISALCVALLWPV